MIWDNRNFKFQSTLPLRGATKSIGKCTLSNNFNPRSPYGERQEYPYTPPLNVPFQSTLPLRGATNIPPNSVLLVDISIHAPLTGSDLRDLTDDMYLCSFQSTLPLRGATSSGAAMLIRLKFQSTLPLRGATWAAAWAT